jgi:hypothetical protein
VGIERQTSFAAGELSPRLHGRTDLPLHRHGARTLENFFVSKEGNAVSRPGTKKLSKCKQANVVLRPFVYSPSVGCVLEFGDYYVRIHHPETGYSGIELATPFWAALVAEASFAQVGARLYMTHTASQPYVLAAPEGGDLFVGTWTLKAAQFTPPAVSPSDATPLPAVFLYPGGGSFWEPMLGDVTAGTLFTKDSDHPPREWTWKLSTLFENQTTKERREGLPYTVARYKTGASYAAATVGLLGSRQVVCDPQTPVKIYFDTIGGGYIPDGWTDASDWKPIAQVFYRGRGQLFGYVGQAEIATGASGLYIFTDNGDEPNYARQPLAGTYPYNYDQPGALGFFQQRLAFGGNGQTPSTIKFSAVDQWENFDELVGPFVSPDMPLEFTLAHSRRETILHLMALGHFAVLTDGGTWTLGPSEGSDGFGFSAQFRRVSDEGASRVPPTMARDGLVFVPARGRGLRELAQTQNGLGVADPSWHVEHLFAPGSGYTTAPTVVSMAYASEPWGVLWVVLSDGSLLSATRTGDTWAWARHFSSSLKHPLPYEEYVGDIPPVAELQCDAVSVCSVPRSTHDAVFVAMTRLDGTYIESLNRRDTTTLVNAANASGDDAIALDSWVAFESFGTSSEVELNGLQHLKGLEVWVVSPGNPTQGPCVVPSSGALTLTTGSVSNQAGGYVTLFVGLKFACTLETLDVAPGSLNQKTTVRVGFEVNSGPGLEVGEDLEHLSVVRDRAVADGYSMPSAATSMVVVNVKGAWRTGGRAVLRQSNPAPVTVYGVAREVANGG